jgi:GcrA cell cycle regulator
MTRKKQRAEPRPWTTDEVAVLRQEWALGTPTQAIGRLLGRPKDAVIGKAHRLDLPARPSPIRPSTHWAIARGAS